MPPRTHSPFQPIVPREESYGAIMSSDDKENNLRLAQMFNLPPGCNFKRHSTTSTTETDQGIETTVHTIEYQNGKLVEMNESITHSLTETEDSITEVDGKSVFNTTADNGKLVECEESTFKTIVTTMETRSVTDEKRVSVVTHSDDEIVDRDETMTHTVTKGEDGSVNENEESVVHITVTTPEKVIVSGDVISRSMETFADEVIESDRSFIYCTVSTDEKAINKEEETIYITETDSEGHKQCTDSTIHSVWEETEAGEVGTTKETTHTLKIVCDQVEEHITTHERFIDSTNEELVGRIEGTESSFVAIEGTDGSSAHVEEQKRHFVGTTEDDQYSFEQHDNYCSYVDTEDGRIPLRESEMVYAEADTEGGYQISVRTAEDNDGQRSVGNREIFFETMENEDGELEDVERKDISYTETEAEDGATLLSLKTVSTDDFGLRTTEERDSFIAVMDEEGETFIAETDTTVRAVENEEGMTDVVVTTEDKRKGQTRTSETEYSFVTDAPALDYYGEEGAIEHGQEDEEEDEDEELARLRMEAQEASEELNASLRRLEAEEAYEEAMAAAEASLAASVPTANDSLRPNLDDYSYDYSYEEDVASDSEEDDSTSAGWYEGEAPLRRMCAGCVAGEGCEDPGRCASAAMFDEVLEDEGEDDELMTEEDAVDGARDISPPAADDLEFVEFAWPYQGEEVSLTGAFCEWDEGVKMRWSEERGEFLAVLALPRGETFEFMFVVDGEPKYDCEMQHLCTEEGNVFNFITI